MWAISVEQLSRSQGHERPTPLPFEPSEGEERLVKHARRSDLSQNNCSPQTAHSQIPSKLQTCIPMCENEIKKEMQLRVKSDKDDRFGGSICLSLVSDWTSVHCSSSSNINWTTEFSTLPVQIMEEADHCSCYHSILWRNKLFENLHFGEEYSDTNL